MSNGGNPLSWIPFSITGRLPWSLFEAAFLFLWGMNDGGEKGEYIGLVRVVDLQNKNYYILGVQGRMPNWERFKGSHAFSIFVAKFQSCYVTFHTYSLLKLYLSSKHGRVSECNV